MKPASAGEARELRPRGAGWVEDREAARVVRGTVAVSVWRSGSLSVVSSLVLADLPRGGGVGPQWHVSVSDGGARPRRDSVRRALAAFKMLGAEEDNHLPGRARHFWRPLDPAERIDCECKVTEVAVVEPDGHRWSNRREGPCRGCEGTVFTGIPCPLHAVPRL